MSRSKKKPYIKDGAHWKKKIHSRKMRAITKQILHVFKTQYKEDLEPDLPHPNKLTNKYDICDWWWYCPLNNKAYRK